MSQNAAMLPDPKPASAAQGFPLPEVLITVLYLVLATGWIIGSDAALERMAGYPEESAPLQTLKGLNFVVTTSALLYLLLRRLYTRRRQAEQMVREQAERFELVARAASDLLWDVDLKADRVWWSPGFAASFGEPPQGLGPTLEGWYRRVHPEDRDRVRMGVEAALAPAGSRSWSHQYRFQRSDGSYATVVGRGWVEAGEDGTAIRIVGGITDVTARVEAEQELRRSREQLRALSVRLQTLREDERTHIAREIHDELGQLLTGLRMNLRWAEDQLAAGVAGLALNSVLDRVVEATELTDQVLSAVRRIATELRPSVLDALGLFQALRLEAVRFEQQSGIPCHLSLPEVSPQLGPETRTAVFRIFQEALTNVTRHAQATRVEASFRTEDERGVVEVKDNGRGLGATRTTEGPSLGLLGMQERAAAVYGSVVFKEAPGGGTVVQLGFPLRTNPEPGASRAAPQS